MTSRVVAGNRTFDFGEFPDYAYHGFISMRSPRNDMKLPSILTISVTSWNVANRAPEDGSSTTPLTVSALCSLCGYYHRIVARHRSLTAMGPVTGFT